MQAIMVLVLPDGERQELVQLLLLSSLKRHPSCYVLVLQYDLKVQPN